MRSDEEDYAARLMSSWQDLLSTRFAFDHVPGVHQFSMRNLFRWLSWIFFVRSPDQLHLSMRGLFFAKLLPDLQSLPFWWRMRMINE